MLRFTIYFGDFFGCKWFLALQTTCTSKFRRRFFIELWQNAHRSSTTSLRHFTKELIARFLCDFDTWIDVRVMTLNSKFQNNKAATERRSRNHVALLKINQNKSSRLVLNSILSLIPDVILNENVCASRQIDSCRAECQSFWKLTTQRYIDFQDTHPHQLRVPLSTWFGRTLVSARGS